MRVDEPTRPAYISFPDYEWTDGPRVVEVCKMAGFIPDPEQVLALDIIFALNDAEKLAAYEFAIVACRQNIKTGLFKMAALGWLFVTDQRLIVWSAHEFSTAQEAHGDMCDLIKSCPELDEQVAHYYYGNGDESIELKNGCRLIFKARTKGGGRGLSGDKVVLDEAFALQDTHMGALVPLMRARPDGQLIYGSSAPKADSKVLHRLMKRGRAGKSSRLAYVEWSAPEGGCALPECSHEFGVVTGCAMDDRNNWRLANTALGRRITYESMQAERELLDPAEFGRELLGWPDAETGENAEPIYGAGKWEACAVPAGESKAETRRCFALAVTLDRKYACIGMAGETRWLDDAGDEVTGLHLEPITQFVGLVGVVAEAKRLYEAHRFPFVVDSKGPADSLIPALKEADIEVIEATLDDTIDAFTMLYDGVQAGLVHHMSYPELDSAVDGAAERFIGDRKALGRKSSKFDTSPLEAVQLAAWGSWSGHGADYNLMNSFF